MQHRRRRGERFRGRRHGPARRHLRRDRQAFLERGHLHGEHGINAERDAPSGPVIRRGGDSRQRVGHGQRRLGDAVDVDRRGRPHDRRREVEETARTVAGWPPHGHGLAGDRASAADVESGRHPQSAVSCHPRRVGHEAGDHLHLTTPQHQVIPPSDPRLPRFVRDDHDRHLVCSHEVDPPGVCPVGVAGHDLRE